MKRKVSLIASLLISVTVATLASLSALAHSPMMMDENSGTESYMGHHGMMEPGMMMGRNIGSGMMYGNYGRGMHGMMMGGYYLSDLSDKQLSKMNDIRNKLEKDLWQLKGQILDEQAKLRDLWMADKPDPTKVGAAYAEAFEFEREAIETRVKAMNEMYDVLTNEQREKLKSNRLRMMGSGTMFRGGHMMMR